MGPTWQGDDKQWRRASNSTSTGDPRFGVSGVSLSSESQALLLTAGTEGFHTPQFQESVHKWSSYSTYLASEMLTPLLYCTAPIRKTR